MSNLHEAIAALALRYVSRPFRDDEPVIEWRTPEDLEAAFADTVGLGLSAPEPAHDDAAVLRAAEQVIRYSVHTTHPRFVNQNFAGPTPIAVVGDWLAAALNTTNATFEAAPVFTLMERAVLTRLAQIAGYPKAGTIAPGLFAPGGSSATLYALQLARHRTDPEARTRGSRESYAIFVSDSGHYSVRKSAVLLGLGTDAVVPVATDPGGRMRVDELERAITASEQVGRVPLAVVATAGTTVTSAFDPIDGIADITEPRGIWLHVDGAWGGSALMSPAQAWRLAGVERSDSFLWNLHKMLGMTQQCSTLLVRDPDLLAPCFASNADYLFQPDKLYAELDSGDRTFQCARRVDVLKAWLAWKHQGDAGFAARIDHAVAMGDHARARIDESPDFCAVVPGDFSNVCFTWVPPEAEGLSFADFDDQLRARLHALQPRIKERMQREGTSMIGFQPVHGMNCFRLIFNNPEVGSAEVDRLLELVRRYAVEAWAQLS